MRLVDCHKPLNRMLPSGEQKLTMITTLLGQAAIVTQEIMERIKPEDVPYKTRYAITVIISLLYSLDAAMKGAISTEDIEVVDLTTADLPDREKCAQIIKQLHNQCVKDGLIKV